MRVLRWMVLVTGMLGGLLCLGVTAEAAPLPVAAGTVEQVSPAPGIQKAYYYGRRFYRRPFYRRFYGPRRFYGRPFYRRPFYRRPFYRRRFYY